MNFLRPHANFLGLNKNDLLVLSGLATPLQVAELSRKTKIARTSLYTTLENLKKRKLVEKVGAGKRKAWVAITPQQIEKITEGLHLAVQSSNRTSQKIGIATSRSTEMVLHRGIGNLVTLYNRILELSKHERLFILQPNQSTELVIRKFPFDQMLKINRYIKERKIIVEAVVHENAIEHYLGTMAKENNSPKMIRDMFAAVSNRLAQTTYIPKEFMTVKSELYMLHDVALIMNWDEEVGIEIKNPDIVGMLRQLFAFVQSYGKKVDQNPRISEFISRFP